MSLFKIKIHLASIGSFHTMGTGLEPIHYPTLELSLAMREKALSLVISLQGVWQPKLVLEASTCLMRTAHLVLR